MLYFDWFKTLTYYNSIMKLQRNSGCLYRKTQKFPEHHIGIQWVYNYVPLGLWPQSIITDSLCIWDHFSHPIHTPEKLVEISVFHVLEDHDKRVTVHADAVELHYVLVLKIGQQLGLPLEVFPCRKGGVLQGLQRNRRQSAPNNHKMSYSARYFGGNFN